MHGTHQSQMWLRLKVSSALQTTAAIWRNGRIFRAGGLRRFSLAPECGRACKCMSEVDHCRIFRLRWTWSWLGKIPVERWSQPNIMCRKPQTCLSRGKTSFTPFFYCKAPCWRRCDKKFLTNFDFGFSIENSEDYCLRFKKGFYSSTIR